MNNDKDKITYPAKLECPFCGHEEKFVLSIQATLASLEDINWKQKVKDVIEQTDFTADTPLEREAIKLKLLNRLGI